MLIFSLSSCGNFADKPVNEDDTGVQSGSQSTVDSDSEDEADSSEDPSSNKPEGNEPDGNEPDGDEPVVNEPYKDPVDDITPDIYDDVSEGYEKVL